MGIESILTFIGVGAIVVVLALYLITVATMLRHVSFTVGTILIGVRAIAAQCAPIGGVVRDIVREVQAIEEDLDALLTGAEEEEPARRQVGAGR
ncbi:MAG: hypothetical protein ABR540_01955 [Acidimicrobiales bacterium]|nr:hypothetical protein [Actinomycetota bacterium]